MAVGTLMSSVALPSAFDLIPFAAEGVICIGIATLLLLVTIFGRSRSIATATTVATLAGALFCLLNYSAPLEAGPRFGTLLMHDQVAVYFKAVLLLFTLGIVFIWWSAPEENTPHKDGAEFFTLLLGATLGMALMGSTQNLLMIWIAVELASLPSYALAGYRRSRRSAEASLKYVLFGAASSAIMVYGLSLLYGLCGSLQYEAITQQLIPGSAMSPLLVIALLSVLVGLAFKIAAVPLHFWCPDVFEGASIHVTAFLSVASKAAGLILLLRLLSILASHEQFAATPLLTWTSIVIGVMGAITATVGNLAALPQRNFKRLFAWSSIAHAGYMLCVMSLLIRHGLRDTSHPDPAAGAGALLIYLAIYLFMNLGAFAVGAIVQNRSATEDIAGFNALGSRSPILAIAMSICLLSLIGLPPLAGFSAKLVLITALLENGSWWIALVAVVAINTIISLAYYARLLKAMWLTQETDTTPNPIDAPFSATAVATLSAAALVILFVAFNPLMTLATNTARALYAALLP